jgi:apolipoprotein D and lipocalin family protein
MEITIRTIIAMSLLSLLGACRSSHPPISTEAKVDVERFMGDWYVIANIPTSLERGAHNAVESYQLDADGSIATMFTFRDQAFDGKVKRYCPRGFVRDDPSNALWHMQFIWPIKADYRIVHVSPQISAAEFQELSDRVAREGYDISKLERVPQQWPESPSAPPRSAVEQCS